MKKLLLLFVLLASFSQAQTAGCTFSTTPITICYPAQTKNIGQTVQTDIIYLCGSGSVVYDTLNPPSIKYRVVFVNAGATYHYKSTMSNNSITIYAKNGSNVIIYPGTLTTFQFNHIKEPGATLTNLSTGTITTTNCTAVNGPSVNCTATSVNNISQANEATVVWPNPAHDKLCLSTGNSKDKIISIINLLGEVVYSQKGVKDEKQEISLSNFSSGIYYVIVKSGDVTETKKIVVTK